MKIAFAPMYSGTQKVHFWKAKIWTNNIMNIRKLWGSKNIKVKEKTLKVMACLCATIKMFILLANQRTYAC